MERHMDNTPAKATIRTARYELRLSAVELLGKPESSFQSSTWVAFN